MDATTLDLSILCRRADAQNFKVVNIVGLKPGSVFVDSIAEYNYPNNDTQIQFLNHDLKATLENIFNDSVLLKNLSAALGDIVIHVTHIEMQTIEISNISDLEPYVHCTVLFPGFTEEIENGISWICAGPCKKMPNFCNQHGECLNGINVTSCKCTHSNFEGYYGTHCELYRREAGFYAVLFGSLAAFALLLIVLTVMIVVLCRSKRMSSTRKLSQFDEIFDFTSGGMDSVCCFVGVCGYT
ncbi:uncharacterized protein LOC127625991 [Xyrauchen texanus]|uniref:uncharacterized protein LOC127625991 n=1 Tax=Xyrauchen texanus TaxID=154827 RepID=UPI00224203C2|nr:uncharacterized protein LOC127625991 [Xyrauchen texanus]